MPSFEEVKAYIGNLPDTDLFNEKEESEQAKAVFAAQELLSDHIPERKITVRVVALQTLYMLEGESEEFSKYKRHGVTSFATKSVSVSFEGANISPDVLSIVGSNKASVGRLI